MEFLVTMASVNAIEGMIVSVCVDAVMVSEGGVLDFPIAVELDVLPSSTATSVYNYLAMQPF